MIHLFSVDIFVHFNLFLLNLISSIFLFLEGQNFCSLFIISGSFFNYLFNNLVVKLVAKFFLESRYDNCFAEHFLFIIESDQFRSSVSEVINSLINYLIVIVRGEQFRIYFLAVYGVSFFVHSNQKNLIFGLILLVDQFVDSLLVKFISYQSWSDWITSEFLTVFFLSHNRCSWLLFFFVLNQLYFIKFVIVEFRIVFRKSELSYNLPIAIFSKHDCLIFFIYQLWLTVFLEVFFFDILSIHFLL